MSLHNDINNLTQTIESNQRIITKQQKEEEKIRNKIYIAKIELLDDLQTEIKLTLKYNHNPMDAEIKGEIINAILEYSHIIYNRNYTKAFLIENYDKISSKLMKQYEREQKEEERQDNLRKKTIEQQQAKQNLLKGISKVFITIALILTAPFLFIGFFIIGILKNVK